MSEIIKIENLNKSFGNLQAVKNLSFSVERGELFAFLGVNGAGKSTTISIISGTLEKDGGTVTIDGKNIESDMAEICGETGVVFQSSALDGCLSVYDNLLTRAGLYGISGAKAKARIEELSELLDFKDLLPRTLGKLSGGQRRRIDVARALIHSPAILILDEPTTGLDPQTRKTLWKVVKDLRKNDGMTVFLTTHYMEEAAEADHVVILNAGEIVAEGTPVELKNKYTGDFITVYGVDEKDVTKLSKTCEAVAGGYRIAVKNTEEARDLITAYPDIFKDFEVEKGKMDDVFLAVTGRRAGDND